MSRRGWICALALGLLATALGCGGGAESPADAGTDAVDVAADGVGEAVGLDTSTDAAPDAAPDAVSEEGPDTAPDTTPDSTLDATPDVEPDVGTPCTHEGFQVVGARASTCLAAEGGFLELAAADSTTAPANVFGLELLLDERTLGPSTFVDENYATCERCIRIEAGCTNEGGCAKTFLVYAGTMDITAWEDPGGHFTATFTGLRAREVTISTELPLTSTPVAGGETWCIDALTLDVAPLEVF